MKQENSGKSKKRISFLMPYIDFCFMLIIIFLGMLSIAYFEPVGTADIQSEREKKLDRREGEHNIKPTGLQEKREGVGLDTGAEVHPLIAPRTLQPGARGAMERIPGAKSPRAEATKEDIAKLKRELEEKEKKLKELEEKLKERKEGRGDHLYIDLGAE